MYAMSWQAFCLKVQYRTGREVCQYTVFIDTFIFVRYNQRAFYDIYNKEEIEHGTS